MCGFLAWFHPPGLSDRSDDVRRATSTMSHRGPDGEGIFLDRAVALGHRRLSIIDAPGGAQPFFSDDGDLALVYNGEVYNFSEIRSELEAKGHAFRSRSDTEVILLAYREWGTACVSRFNGMFAFALWDKPKQTLWIVRDRLGIKPLYHWTDGTSFACASEIRPLLSLGVPREFNEEAVDAYLTLGYVPAPQTFFRGIRKLEPGTFLEVGTSGIRQTRYWDFSLGPPREMEEGMARETLATLLLDCTRSCTVSDVPIGVLLSGGLDSSAVAALMHEAGIDPINSFTIGYDNAAAENEEDYARVVAGRFHCRHFVRVMDSLDFFGSIDKLIEFTEEPLVEPAAIALYHLSLLARSEVKVVLSGEGSDEVFAGYGLYRRMLDIERWHRRIPHLARALTRTGARLVPAPRLAKHLDWCSEPLETRYRGTSATLTPALKGRLYSPDFLASRGTYLEDVFANLFSRIPPETPLLSKLLYVDSKTWLPDDLLLKADKMTMAASIELRVPFLDHRLVEFATSLPSRFKIRDGSGKWILKECLRTRLPEAIVDRSKMGFPVPTRSWMNSASFAKVRDQLIESRARIPWIRPSTLEHLFCAARPFSPEESRFILSLLILTRWRERNGV